MNNARSIDCELKHSKFVKNILHEIQDIIKYILQIMLI